MTPGSNSRAKTMKKLVLIATLAILAGCAHLETPHVSSMNFDGGSMEYVGIVHGQYEYFTYLWLISSDAETSPAIDILDKKREELAADAVINVVVENSATYILGGIVVKNTVTVSGTAVKFKKRLSENQSHEGELIQKPPEEK